MTNTTETKHHDEINAQDEGWQLSESELDEVFQQLSGNLAGC